jgi:hypothetical protein
MATRYVYLFLISYLLESRSKYERVLNFISNFSVIFELKNRKTKVTLAIRSHSNFKLTTVRGVIVVNTNST